MRAKKRSPEHSNSIKYLHPCFFSDDSARQGQYLTGTCNYTDITLSCSQLRPEIPSRREESDKGASWEEVEMFWVIRLLDVGGDVIDACHKCASASELLPPPPMYFCTCGTEHAMKSFIIIFFFSHRSPLTVQVQVQRLQNHQTG